MPLKSRLKSLVLSMILIVAFSAAASAANPKKIPKFFISNIEGARFTTSEQKQPYVISFFFVDCVPCRKEIPVLYETLSKEFPQVPLLFIDPLETDTPETIQEFAQSVAKVPLKYFYHDAFGGIGKKFFEGKMKFPTIVGVHKGQQLFVYPGLDEKTLDEIRGYLKAAM